MDAYLAIGGFFLGLVGSWWALQDRLKDRGTQAAEAKVKEYAAQRDFAHLQRNYEQLTANIEVMAREQDESLNDIRQMLRQNQMMLQVLIGKSGDSISGIFKA